MPKRKKRLRASKAEQRAAAKSQPASRKRSNRKHIYTESPDTIVGPAPGTLGYYFYSLPQELRNEIFAWLLVRPVKWDVKHKLSCPVYIEIPDHRVLQPYFYQPLGESTCANAYSDDANAWRHRDEDRNPIFMDCWRSRWAPPQLNPYLCTICYDSMHRQKPYPVTRSLPCICARYNNLETLLVCRRWYEEAGRVFYSRNTFAFTWVMECTEFFRNLPPRWKPFISKVSLLQFSIAYPPKDELDMIPIPIKNDGLANAWQLLASLPALSELELDAILLTRLSSVTVFRGLALKNLCRLTFTQSDPNYADDDSRCFVWPRRALRHEICDSEFAEHVARGIKGQRYGWKKGKKRSRADAKAVEQERQRYLRRIKEMRVPWREDDNEQEESDGED